MVAQTGLNVTLKQRIVPFLTNQISQMSPNLYIHHTIFCFKLQYTALLLLWISAPRHSLLVTGSLES